MIVKALNVEKGKIGEFIESLRCGHVEFKLTYEERTTHDKNAKLVFSVIEFDYPQNITDWYNTELKSAILHFKSYIV